MKVPFLFQPFVLCIRFFAFIFEGLLELNELCVIRCLGLQDRAWPLVGTCGQC